MRKNEERGGERLTREIDYRVREAFSQPVML